MVHRKVEREVLYMAKNNSESLKSGDNKENSEKIEFYQEEKYRLIDC